MADVHATGESEASVHGENFAVVAEVDGGNLPRRDERRWQKARARDIGVAQVMENGRKRIARAGGINEHAHFHAAFDRATKRGDELFAAGVIVENVGAEGDRLLRGLDGGEHRGERFVARDERADAVARHERAGRDAANDPRHHAEMLGPDLFGFAEVFRDGPDGDAMDAERNGTAANAVDAQDEVEQGTQQGDKPDDADPERGGAGIAFVKQGMN